MKTKNPSFLKRFLTSIWPLQKGDYIKFIPMFIIFFLISFNYNILRAAKDTLIITAPSSGAEAIPFIKVWIMLPSAILITYIFTKLSNKFKREKVFYFMLSIFLVFFAIFTMIIYPIREHLHPVAFAEHLKQVLPVGLHGFVALLRNWTLTLFYVMSELWGTAILTVLFWGFANDVTNVKEAKRYYVFFGVGANLASIISGQIAIFFSKISYNPNLFFGKDAWEQSVLFLNATIIIIGILIMVIFRFLNQKVINTENISSQQDHVEKPKMSMRKNFSYLTKSKYLLCMAIIVLAYNITINLVEILWKNQVKMLYPNASDYNSYMGQVMTITGIIATFIALFISNNLLKKLSWSFSALIPPIIVLITGVCFFSFYLYHDSFLKSIAVLCGTTPMIMCAFFGSMQNCMSRAAKYTLFDATKEIAFIPLSKESKLKGKAAIDGVGSRIGKSGGSVIHQGLLLIFATLSASTPYVASIFLLVVGAWIIAVSSLGKQFNERVAQSENVDIPKPTKEEEAIVTN